ncbi:MAG: aminotransferase class V-fold PLP-dependent enzyme, partial [Ignavibacteria bacterium]|nr:aminotransferase class V-fold PLP-dependent enzyme [Ignavibacteria bacterium]
MKVPRLPVFLDNHSTTRVDPRVTEEMLPFFDVSYGNASSRQHRFGWEAEAAVELARVRIADLVHSEPDEIFFTSGATESINLCIKGIAEGLSASGNHIVTCTTEHKAALDTVSRLERYGLRVTLVPVDRYGLVSPADILDAMEKGTILVSVMMANNEIGTIAPISTIGSMCREKGVFFHVDAAQAVGRIPVDVRSLQIDLLSFSAHKMYGPKGVGAAFIRKATPRIPVSAQLDGGGHESGIRPGTLNVPGIVGFGKAAELAAAEMQEEVIRVSHLRDRLVGELTSSLDGVTVNGHPEQRLPNNANLAFSGCNADAIMMAMKDIAVSSGSACSSRRH